jgi:hypothetical protein
MRGDPGDQREADRLAAADGDAADEAAFGRQQEEEDPEQRADDRSLYPLDCPGAPRRL